MWWRTASGRRRWRRRLACPAPSPAPAHGRSGADGWHWRYARTAWQILNSNFTMSKHKTRGRAPSVPSRDKTRNFTQELAAGGVRNRRLMRAALRAAVAGEELAHLIGAHRLSEIPALPDLAAKRDHGFVGRLVLDTLDADGNRQRAGERRNRADDCAVLTLRIHVADEAAVVF